MTNTNSIYYIISIEPKDGKLREVHEEVLYSEAYVVEAEPGFPGVLKVLQPYNDRYHTLRTSLVLRCTPLGDNPDTIVMETENTIYTLKKM